MKSKEKTVKTHREIKENMDQKGIRGIISFVKEMMDKVNYDEAMPFAFQTAYSLLFSMFPFMIFLFTLIGFLNLDSNKVLSGLMKVMPSDLFNMISGTLKEIMEKQSGGLLSISIILAIWSASRGFRAFIDALNKIHNLDEDRSVVIITIQSVVYVVVFTLAIVLSLVLVIFGNQLFNLLTSLIPGVNFSVLKSAISFIAPLVLVFGLFIVFYMFVPSRKIKFKYALPGAIFSALSFTIVSLVFKFYVDGFANYSKFYGAMGTVIVLMIWLQLISQIMVYGAEINSLLIIKKGIHSPYFKKKIKISEFDVLKERYSKIKGVKRTDEAQETLDTSLTEKTLKSQDPLDKAKEDLKVNDDNLINIEPNIVSKDIPNKNENNRLKKVEKRFTSEDSDNHNSRNKKSDYVEFK